MDQVHPLRAYRDKQAPRLSQDQLAQMLGVKRTTVARWETGTRRVARTLLPGISEKTGIAPAELRPDLAALMGAEAAE